MSDSLHEILIPSEFARLLDRDWREAIVEGGRYSLKSHTVGRICLIRTMQAKTRVLCGREFQNSISESVHQLLADLIDLYELRGIFEVTRDSIVNRQNGSDFIFRGVRHNAQSIKSIEGVDIFWGEESQTFSRESIDIISPTVRKPGSQLIWTMNRLLELDPIYERLVVRDRPGVLHIKANYDVAEKYGWLPREIKVEIEHDRMTDPNLYTHKWLGEPISQADTAILGRGAVLGAMERSVSDEGAVEVGVDVARMGNDRTQLYKRKGMRLVGAKTYTKLRTTEVCDKIELFVDFNKGVLLKIDDTGVGCVTPETKILTPGGWRPASTLMPGDELYSKDADGNVVVERVQSNTTRETEILKAGHYEFAWAHLIPYRTRNSNPVKLDRWVDIVNSPYSIFDTAFRYEAERVDFVLAEHSVTMPNGGSKSVVVETHVNANEFALFLGWYVSEGSIDRTSRCVTISQKKEQNFEEIERVMSYFGKVQRKRSGNGYDFKVFNTSLMRWVDEHCYRGGIGFKYKAVPRFIANNSVDVITDFLRAFRDGDGYIHHDRNYYVTSSVNLVDDLKELIYKTGRSAASYVKNKAGSTFEIEDRVATRTEDNHCIFEYSRPGYGITKREPTVRVGQVHSLIITGETRLMFTMTPGAKPIWTHNGGVTDEMIRRGYRVLAVNFGAKASDPDKYPNLISEAWFYLQSIIDSIQLDMDDELLQELTSRLWKMDSKGRRAVESKDDYKKRGNRSPDKADALILCYYNNAPATIEPVPDLDEDYEDEPITSGLLNTAF